MPGASEGSLRPFWICYTLLILTLAAMVIAFAATSLIALAAGLVLGAITAVLTIKYFFLGNG